MLKIILNLFDGEGASSGDGETANPGLANQGNKGAYSNVVFGKQTEGESQSPSGETVGATDIVDRATAYENFKREYKDEYTKDFQDKFNRRFKEVKQTEAQLADANRVLDTIKAKYGVAELKDLEKAIDQDTTFWAEAADEAGMTVDQYKEMQKLRKENAQFIAQHEEMQKQQFAKSKVDSWMAEANDYKLKNSKFNFQAEAENPAFVRLLQSGVPVEHAYKVIHMDDIVADAKMTTRSETEKAVVNNIRSRGTRPQENGSISQSAFIVKDDPSKFSRADRAEIARRVARGEKITL